MYKLDYALFIVLKLYIYTFMYVYTLLLQCLQNILHLTQNVECLTTKINILQ